MRRLFPANNFVAPKFPHKGKDLVRLVVAEAPGTEENSVGEPLVGGSGRVFNKLLERTGINRDGLTIVNCLNCQPPDNVFPTDPEARSYISKDDADKAVKQCLRHHVLPLLESRNWARIDLLGGKALHWLANKSPITIWRGSPVDIDTDEIKSRI